MSEPHVERVITRDRSSGRYHIRLYVDGHTYVQEADNLDIAGTYDVVPDLPEDIESALFCRRCFPDMHDIRPANTEEV